MDAIDIQYLLKKRGYTLQAIADEYGCSRQTVTLAIRRNTWSPGIQHFLAHKLDMPREKLFPKSKIHNNGSGEQKEKAVLT